MYRLFVLLLVFLSFPVAARDGEGANPFSATEISPRPIPKPDEFRILISRRDCQKIVRHTASADSVYQPGVDVRGKKVVPADLDDGLSGFKIPDEIVLDLNLGILAYAGNSVLADIFANSSSNIGTVHYSRVNGEIRLNGRAPGKDDLELIAKYCRTQGGLK